jgi:hypothetical protein
MSDVVNRRRLPAGELQWVRFELEMLLSCRSVCPFSAAEQTRYRELGQREAELLLERAVLPQGIVGGDVHLGTVTTRGAVLAQGDPGRLRWRPGRCRVWRLDPRAGALRGS